MCNSDLDDSELQIGIRSEEVTLPTNFRFTVLAEIAPGRVFHDRSLAVMNLYAAGTKEGPVVLFTITGQSIEFVCLCCCHTSDVTDIKQLPNNQLFVSADSSGSVSVWSNRDGSLISTFPNVVARGKVCISVIDSQSIIVWTLGGNGYLLNINTGVVEKSLNTTGLMGVALITTGGECTITSRDVVVALSCLSVKVFDTNLEPLRYLINKAGIHETTHVSEYGVIRTSKNEWRLLSPEYFNDIATGTIKILKSDAISAVQWCSRDTFCLSTYTSRFFIISLKEVPGVTHTKVVVDQCIEIRGNKLDYTNRFLYTDSKIIHVNRKGLIECVFPTGKLVTSSDKTVNHLCFVNNDTILQSDGSSTLFVFDAETSAYFDADSPITSLICYSAMRDIEIAAGTADGRVCFFNKTRGLTRSVIVLSERITGLVFLRHSKTLVVIGSEGTIALMYHRTVIMVFASTEFPVKHLFHCEKSNSLAILRTDNIYVTFSMSDPGPTGISGTLSSEFKMIWSASEVGESCNRKYESMVVMGPSTIHFACVSLKQLLSDREENESVRKSIIDLFEWKPEEEDFRKSQSVNFRNIGAKKSLTRSHSIESLTNLEKMAKVRITDSMAKFECETGLNSLSFVVIGKGRNPTFFYRKYQLRGIILFKASPQIATTHFMAKAVLSGDHLEHLDDDLLL